VGSRIRKASLGQRGRKIEVPIPGRNWERKRNGSKLVASESVKKKNGEKKL